MASAPTSAAGASATAAAPAPAELGKGGKVKVVHGKARAAAVAHSEAVLAARRARLADFADGYETAMLVLSVDGMGYIDRETHAFTTEAPGATGAKVKTATRFSETSARPQFIITVGFGRKDGVPFGNTRCLVVSNPIFFKDGDAVSKKAQLVGGHDPIIQAGKTYVFAQRKEGLATYTTAAGFYRGMAMTDQAHVEYDDVVAFLDREEAKKEGGWIKSKLLRIE
jgi:hypothetical protein